MKTATDVSFTSVNDNIHAESSSQAESRSSIGKRSSIASTSRQSEKEKRMPSTPDTSISPSLSTRTHNSGGFLLDSPFANGRLRPASRIPRGKGSTLPNEIVHGSIERPHSRTSLDYSQRSSPLSKEVAYDGVNERATAGGRARQAQPPAMDPAQLVQMALSLSEGRKRHASTPMQAPGSPEATKRVVSGADYSHNAVRATRSRGRASRMSDEHSFDRPLTGVDYGQMNGMFGESITEDNVLYTFSPATLSRAEKARRYFELASEHRRLLEHLPPLKPDASAWDDKHAASVANSTGGHPEYERKGTYFSGKHQLGRPYNPLQALRNRRLRNREKKELPAPPETFQETDRIRRWIDGVAEASKEPDFRPGEDQVRLPEIAAEVDDNNEPFRPDTGKGHRRTDTIGSVVTRPENGWTIEPAELLADTYWVEKGDNKATIQDRHGNRIFPARARQSFDQSRISVDSFRDVDRRSVRDASETEDAGRHRRRLHIPHRLRPHRLGQHNRSVDTLSISSNEGRRNLRADFDSPASREPNIGPLARHMQQMIEQDAREEAGSPELQSPDLWGQQNRSRLPRRSLGPVQSHDPQPTNRSRLSVDSQPPRRSSSTEDRDTGARRGSSSVDGRISDSPSSYSAKPPHRRPASVSDHGRRSSRLPVFRSRNKDSSGIGDQPSIAIAFGTPLSPVHSAENAKTSNKGDDSTSKRPPIGTRRLTGESTTNSLKRLNTATTDMSNTYSTKDSFRESSSSVGRRLFKGGRIGELVRNESSRLGDRFRGGRDRYGDIPGASKATSEASDSYDDVGRSRALPNGSLHEDESDVSPRASSDHGPSDSKYYTSNLPSFTSPAGHHKRPSVVEASANAAKQEEEDRQSVGQALRSGRPVLPIIQIPEAEGISNVDWASQKQDVSRSVSKTRSRSRSASGVNFHSGSMFHPDLARAKSKRHWSISDQLAPDAQHRVTYRDIARVQTLLLASGIKAREILQRANNPPPTPTPLLLAASQLANQPPPPTISRHKQPLEAATLLATACTTQLTTLEPIFHTFQDTRVAALAARLDDLQRRAGDELTHSVADASDRADAFVVELTTKQPQDVQRVDDAVDAMLRLRRRQFRVLRYLGFKVLEWFVLIVLWGLWFVVVLWKMLRRGVVGVGRGVRWLVWF